MATNGQKKRCNGFRYPVAVPADDQKKTEGSGGFYTFHVVCPICGRRVKAHGNNDWSAPPTIGKHFTHHA